MGYATETERLALRISPDHKNALERVSRKHYLPVKLVVLACLFDGDVNDRGSALRKSLRVELKAAREERIKSAQAKRKTKRR